MLAARTPATGAPRRYAEGTTITRQGDPVDSPAIVVRGLIRLSALSDDGREVVLALIGPGEAFDECALTDEPSGMTALALIDTEVRRGGKDAGAASELEVALARRLSTTSRLLEETLLHDVRARLLRRLQDLAGRRHAGMRLPLTQDEVGRMIGASRETVNRALRDLTGRGALDAAARSAVRSGPPRSRP